MNLYPVLSASVGAENAQKIARRLLGDDQGFSPWEVESTATYHPLWGVRFDIDKHPRASALLPNTLTVTVDAVSGRGHIVADTRLRSHLAAAVTSAQQQSQKQPRPAGATLSGLDLDFATPHRKPRIDAARAEQIARVLAATALRKRAKLGVSFNLALADPLALVLKPNWLITALNKHTQTRLLIDGFDGSHYVISYSNNAVSHAVATPTDIP